MNDFSFYNPTRLLFGKNAVQKRLSRALANYTNVLIVYGSGSIKRNSVYDDVLAVLQQENKTVVELSGVTPNPRVSVANEGARLCKLHDIDVVLALGGGSVIDCTKLIAAATHYDGDAWDIVLGTVKITKALPIGVVLTLAATGSEMNAGSVITNEATKEKRDWSSVHVYPTFSIADPTYTLSVPQDHTMYGIIDMMSHIFEQYFHDATNTNVTDAMAESLLRTIIEVGPNVMNNPTNYAARETLLLAGTIGLNGFLSLGSNGDWATHDIEHAVSAIYDIPHAAGLAILFPHWMRYVLHYNPNRFAQLAIRVWDVNSNEKTIEQIAEEGIQKLVQFWTALGAPSTLSYYNIEVTSFDDIVKRATATKLGAFAPLDENDVHNILQAAK